MSEAPFPVEPARRRRPRLGYLMASAAALLWGVNGAVSKTILSTGLSSERLAQVRSLGAAVGLLAVIAVTAPRKLRLTRRELPYLIVFGVVGLAFVQWFYFLAIHRLAIGIALLIQYLGPLLVAIYARTFGHERVRRRVWAALALSLAGLSLMVELWSGVALDGLGVVYALISAVIFAAYLLLAEHEVKHRDSISLMAWGFFFASVFWAIAQPWWTFPAHRVARTVSLDGRLAGWHLPVWALVLWIVVLGSIVPFSLIVAALRHVSATRVGIAAMLEPVVATIVAWAWLRETLAPVQLAGAAVVLAGILLAQTAR
jgi:drug/metabolite transporter (DMT)-like permease